MVVNDGHSGFFTVQYECERSWALALAALEQGAMDECETMGFVHDLILGLHQGMVVDREADGAGGIGIGTDDGCGDGDGDGDGYDGAHGRHCSVPRLFSRLRDVVRLLARDRSHPAWCAGQLFIWELLVKYASNVLAEIAELSQRRMLELTFRLPRRLSDRGLAGGGEPDASSGSTASAAAGAIEEGGEEDNGPVRGGTLVVGDARESNRTDELGQPPEAAAATARPSAAAPLADGENAVHPATARRQRGTGTRPGGSLPSPGMEATSVACGAGTGAAPRAASATAVVTDDDSRGDGRTAVAAPAATPPAVSAALLPSEDDLAATVKSACARLRDVTTDMEAAYGEVKEHMRWHAEKAVPDAEQATEAFQTLHAMRGWILHTLLKCRTQLAWDADMI